MIAVDLYTDLYHIKYLIHYDYHQALSIFYKDDNYDMMQSHDFSLDTTQVYSKTFQLRYEAGILNLFYLKTGYTYVEGLERFLIV